MQLCKYILETREITIRPRCRLQGTNSMCWWLLIQFATTAWFRRGSTYITRLSRTQRWPFARCAYTTHHPWGAARLQNRGPTDPQFKARSHSASRRPQTSTLCSPFSAACLAVVYASRCQSPQSCSWSSSLSLVPPPHHSGLAAGLRDGPALLCCRRVAQRSPHFVVTSQPSTVCIVGCVCGDSSKSWQRSSCWLYHPSPPIDRWPQVADDGAIYHHANEGAISRLLVVGHLLRGGSAPAYPLPWSGATVLVPSREGITHIPICMVKESGLWLC